MISGLGCAARLVTENLQQYRKNMLEMRDLLENLLKVNRFILTVICITTALFLFVISKNLETRLG